MTVKPPLPHLEVAVAVVTEGRRILTVYNRNWGAYCLPMTKRRRWEDPNAADGVRVESWEDAAIRARSESLRGTVTGLPELVRVIPEWQQSDRDGKWKRFSFHVFRFTREDAPLAAGVDVEWLTSEEIMDQHRRPISKTSRDILTDAKAQAELDGRVFP